MDDGGLGSWELSVRWSSLDANDSAIEGGAVEVYSLGLNWWLTSRFVFSVNYRRIELARFGSEGISHGLMSRIVLSL